MNNQPFVTIQSKPNYHEIALNNAAVISDFSKVLDDRNKEIAELRGKIVELEEECGQEEYRSSENAYSAETWARKSDRLEKENSELKEFKKNWIELKTQIAFSVENYGDEHDTSVAEQVLKEMNKLEGDEG